MKKVLLATSALVVTAGFASAEVTLSGAANMGLKYNEAVNGGDAYLWNEIDVAIKGTGESDAGIEFGAQLNLDGGYNGATGAVDALEDSFKTWISYNGLTLTAGTNVDSADDRGGLSDIGFDGIGIDDVAETGLYAGGDHTVRVDYEMGDYKVAVSANDANDEWALGASAKFAGVSVDLGYNEDGTNDTTSLTLGYAMDAYGVKLFVADHSALADASWGLEGSYKAGDLKVTAVYAESNGADAFGIGAAYDLGGGLTLAGGLGEENGNKAADLGVSFKF